MSRFEVGQNVVVTEVGDNYSGYSEGQILSQHCRNGVLGQIVNKPANLEVRLSTYAIVNFVMIQGHVYCIGWSGLELAPSWMVRSDGDRDDSWRSWGGGDCPLPDDVLTEVWLRHQTSPQSDTREACRWRWYHAQHNGRGGSSDIVYYREVRNE